MGLNDLIKLLTELRDRLPRTTEPIDPKVVVETCYDGQPYKFDLQAVRAVTITVTSEGTSAEVLLSGDN